MMASVFVDNVHQVKYMQDEMLVIYNDIKYNCSRI